MLFLANLYATVDWQQRWLADTKESNGYEGGNM